jgi:uncharacterized protein (DUF1330 family)
MPVYQIVDLDVHDAGLYARYVAQVGNIVNRYGGRYLARGGKVTPLSGDWQPVRLVLIEFDSLEQLQQCYASPEYREIAAWREQSSQSRSIVVEGL